MSQAYLEILEARDPNTPAHRLSELSYAKNEEVRSLVAQNPNASQYTLLTLAEAFPVEVSNNPIFALYMLERPDFLQRLPQEAALSMASCDELPDAITELLLSHPTPGVKALIARRQKLSEPLLLTLAHNEIEVDQLLARPDLPERVWLTLAQPKSSKGQHFPMDDTGKIFLARTEGLPASARAELEKSQDPQVQSALAWRDEPPIQEPALSLHYEGATETGTLRDHNEDAVGVYHGETLSFFVVVDGMSGGKGTGEIAAQATRDALIEEARRADNTAQNPQEFLHKSFLAAHDAIIEAPYPYPARQYKGKKFSVANAGAAVAAVLLQGNTATIAHIGDSRVYLLRGQKLAQLTEDHNLTNLAKKNNHPLPEEQMQQYKNVLVRGLGMTRASSTPELTRTQTQPGDLFLLCTDGISGMVSEQQLEEELQQTKALSQKVQRLMELCNTTDNKDNMAVVLVQIEGTK